MSTKKYKIVWKTPGSDVEHTIPSEAVVTMLNSYGDRVYFWFTDNEDFCCDGLSLVDDSIKPEL